MALTMSDAMEEVELTREEDEQLMRERLSEITEIGEAISEYLDCIIDKEVAESRRTATCTGVWSKGWKDLSQKAYLERLEHETKKMRREGKEDVQAIETYMMLLRQKFGQDIPTLALNKHNESNRF